MKLRLDLPDGKQGTLREVGEKTGVIREHVPLIEMRALNRLRQPSTLHIFQGYLRNYQKGSRSMEQEINYSIGEWIVHSQYGVGQIKKTEVMPLHGEQTECFKVQVRSGAFWFPTHAVENPRIRPIASQEIITKVIKNLRRKPGNLEKDKKYWTQRIKSIPLDIDLKTSSQLIRDLSAQKALKRLNDTQIKALSKFKERLMYEWAAITGEDIGKIRPQFDKCIRESRAKIPIE